MPVSLASNPLLRAALRLDAIASGAMSVILLAGAPWLRGLLGMPQPLLLAAGAVCLFWGLFVGAVSRRERMTEGVVWAIIVLNAVWVIESAALLLLGWVQPTQLGTAFVIVQALAVAALAELQFVGLTRARRSAAAAA